MSKIPEIYSHNDIEQDSTFYKNIKDKDNFHIIFIAFTTTTRESASVSVLKLMNRKKEN